MFVPVFYLLILNVVGEISRSLRSTSFPPEDDDDILFVSGLRVHNIGAEGFIGYTEAWETIVLPDTEVYIVIFGYMLDKVQYMVVTDQTCTHPEFNISRESLQFHGPTRIEFKFKFPLWDKPWRFCIKHEGPKGDLWLIDDDRTWITTEMVHKKDHWLPVQIRYLVIVLMLCFSALCSGLNLGLMNLSIQELTLIINSGGEKEVRYAKVILPVREKGNYLLCSILLTNVVVNSGISILSEDILAGITALIVSSAAIVVFGEIIPQSFCYKFGLAVGAKTILITKILMWITFPVSYPISRMLDCVVGDTVDQFNRARFVELLKWTSEHEKKNDDSELAENLKIVLGAIEFASKTASSTMTKIDDVYMLSADQILDNVLVAEIIQKGYTRIPVYYDFDRNDVRSLIHIQDVILADKMHEITIGMLAEGSKRQLRAVGEETKLGQLLDEFKKGDYHLAMIYKSSTVMSTSVKDLSDSDEVPFLIMEEIKVQVPSEQTFVGIVTLEDIIEEILQSEIIDEYDTVTDNINRLKRQHSLAPSPMEFNTEKKLPPLPFSVLKVVIGFLEERCMLFEESYMDRKSREILIQRNIRKIVFPSERNSRAVKLIECGTVCRRLILLLEGRASAVFKSGLVLNINAWTFFGDPILEKIMKAKQEKCSVPTSISYVPEFDLVVEQPCKFIQIPVSSLIYTLKIANIIKKAKYRQSGNSLEFDEGGSNRFSLQPQALVSHLTRSRHSLDSMRTRISPDSSQRSMSTIIRSLLPPPLE